MFVSFSMVIEKRTDLSYLDNYEGDACGHKTTLTSPTFIEVPVPSYVNEG